MPSPQPRPRLRYESLRDLLARRIPAREYLIDPFLKQGESTLMYAPPGVGKSMLSMTLALAVAGGGSFLEWKSPAPRRVLMLDGEMAAADLQERARDLIPAVEGIDAEAAGQNLVILARQAQSPDLEFPDLGTLEGQRLVIQKCRRGKFDLCIADNISTLVATLEDENSAAAMRPTVQWLMRMKQAGVAVLAIHHTNKGGESYRGSSMLATTFETIIALRKTGETRDTEGPAFELSFDKYRAKHHDEVTTPRAVHLRKHEGRAQWVAEKAARAHLQAFVEAVRTGEFRSQKQLAEHFQVNKSTITRWKADAIHTFGMIPEKTFDALLAGDTEGIGEGDF